MHNDRIIYGYARVSTDGQSITAQIAELKAAGADKVFREVASGAETDRAQLARAIAALAAGDVLIVTRLDRLARSTRDLLNTLAAIAGNASPAAGSNRVVDAHRRCISAPLKGTAGSDRSNVGWGRAMLMELRA